MKCVIAPTDVQNLMRKLGKGASCAYWPDSNAWVVAHPDRLPMIGKVVPDGERMHFEVLQQGSEGR